MGYRITCGFRLATVDAELVHLPVLSNTSAELSVLLDAGIVDGVELPHRLRTRLE
jgi:hypothetical protein